MHTDMKSVFICAHLWLKTLKLMTLSITLQQRGTRKRSVKAKNGKKFSVLYRPCAPNLRKRLILYPKPAEEQN